MNFSKLVNTAIQQLSNQEYYTAEELNKYVQTMLDYVYKKKYDDDFMERLATLLALDLSIQMSKGIEIEPKEGESK